MDFAALSDRFVVALTLFGEARGEGVLGQIAVACVVRNRLHEAVDTAPRWRDVCLAPKQFSCFNDDDPNRAILDRAAQMLLTREPAPTLRQCLWVADGVMSGACADVTKGARNYVRSDLLTSKPPSWAKGKPVLAVIGAHSFLNA